MTQREFWNREMTELSNKPLRVMQSGPRDRSQGLLTIGRVGTVRGRGKRNNATCNGVGLGPLGNAILAMGMAWSQVWKREKEDTRMHMYDIVVKDTARRPAVRTGS